QTAPHGERPRRRSVLQILRHPSAAARAGRVVGVHQRPQRGHQDDRRRRHPVPCHVGVSRQHPAARRRRGLRARPSRHVHRRRFVARVRPGRPRLDVRRPRPVRGPARGTRPEASVEERQRRLMGEYVQLGDVKTWYEVDGPTDADALVLLHGGMSDGTAWGANAPAMAERYRTFIPDRRGHGKTPDVDGPLTYDDMADDTILFLEQVVGGAARLVGWSDGGIVALLVSMRRTDLVHRQVLVGTNFHHDGLLPDFDLGDDPNADDVGMFKALYEAVAGDLANWPVFFAKTTRMWREEPTLTVDDLKAVHAPTLVLVGDDDAIYFDHTTAL